MLIKNGNKIYSDIKSEIIIIKEYFKNLNTESIDNLTYSSRISEELFFRIENLNGVIRSTLLSYLDMDAREAISDWAPVDKNRFYDKKIRENISGKILENEPYLPNRVLPKAYLYLVGAIIGLGGIYSLFTESRNLLLSLLLISSSVVLIKVAPEKVVSYQKEKSYETLCEYLDKIEENYCKQSAEIINEYVSAFNSINPMEGNENG